MTVTSQQFLLISLRPSYSMGTSYLLYWAPGTDICGLARNRRSEIHNLDKPTIEQDWFFCLYLVLLLLYYNHESVIIYLFLRTISILNFPAISSFHNLPSCILYLMYALNTPITILYPCKLK